MWFSDFRRVWYSPIFIYRVFEKKRGAYEEWLKNIETVIQQLKLFLDV